MAVLGFMTPEKWLGVDWGGEVWGLLTEGIN
jgi:hypothetical protein